MRYLFFQQVTLQYHAVSFLTTYHFTLQYHDVAQHVESFFVTLHFSHKVAQHAVSFFPTTYFGNKAPPLYVARAGTFPQSLCQRGAPSQSVMLPSPNAHTCLGDSNMLRTSTEAAHSTNNVVREVARCMEQILQVQGNQSSESILYEDDNLLTCVATFAQSKHARHPSPLPPPPPPLDLHYIVKLCRARRYNFVMTSFLHGAHTMQDL